MNTAVIIGGGAVGLSTAYHLARKKYGRVIVLEKGRVGDGSSSRAAGIANMFSWHTTGVVTRRQGFELYRQLSEELTGYQFHQVGYLMLFDEQVPQDKQTMMDLYDELDVVYELLSSDEIHARWPALRPPAHLRALFDPEGGYSEPDEYLPALAERIRQLGVDIREQETVVGFLRDSDRVNGVRTASGDVHADAVICTSHVWTLEVLRDVGVDLPIKNFVHQRYLSEVQAEPLETPAVGAGMFNESYVRPASGNRILGGTSTLKREEYNVDSRDFDMSEVTALPGLTAQLTDSLTSVAPQLANVKWEMEKVGLISYSGDYEPILGPIERVPGLYVAACFHSNGFAYNPIAGQLLAEFVADGQTRTDVSIYDPNRFDEDVTERFLSTTIKQSEVVEMRPLKYGRS